MDFQGDLAACEAGLPGFLFSGRLHGECFCVTYVSPGIHADHGTAATANFAVDTLFWEAVHPEDRAALLEVFRRSGTSDDVVEADYRIAHPVKGERWMRLRARPHRLADGGLLWHGLAYDNTERRRTEEDLRQRERAFRSIVENAPDNIVRYDLDNRHRHLNANLVRELGLSDRDDYLGKRPGEVWPDGRFAAIEEASARAIATGEPQRIELTAQFPGGETRLHQILVVAEREETAGIVGTLAFGRDITGIHETEQRLRHFVDNLPGIAYTFRLSGDGHASIPYASSAIREFFGLEPEDVKDDIAPIHDLTHPDDRPVIEAAVADSARTMGALHVELRVCRPGLPERWLEVRSVPARQPNGSILWHGLMLDITERRRMEQSLARSEHEFRSLAESSPDSIIRYDREGRIRYLNSKLEHDLGYTTAELNGKRTCEVWPDGRYAEIEQAMWQAMTEGVARTVVVNVVDNNPGADHHQIRVVPEKDSAGNTIGALAFGRDVTGIYRLRDTLAVRELEYRSLAENTPDNIARWDPAGRFLFSNPANQRALGKPASEMIGKTLGELFPDGRFAVFEDTMARVMSRAQEETVWRVEVPDGTGDVRLHDVKVVPEFDGAGRVISVLALGRDMTEVYRMQDAIAQREQEFRSLAESSPDNILRVDREHRVRYVNGTLARSLGLASPDDLVGKRYFERSQPALVQAEERAMESGEKQSIRISVPLGNNQFADHLVTVVPERDTTGTIIGAIAFGRDITEIKRAERVMQKAIEQLSVSNTELERFAYIASHDLQEPVRTVVSFAQLLDRRLDARLSDEEHEVVAFIVDAGKRMSQLINDLLTFSRVNARSAPFAPVSLTVICREAVANLQDSIQQCAARIDIGEMPEIFGDAVQMVQLFQNLIGNAIKYRRADVQPAVRVSACRQEHEWIITVADNGIGIDDTDQDIFEIFRRLHAVDKFPGTGVGLAVCKRIVQRHNGRIWYESTPGAGATFFVALPG